MKSLISLDIDKNLGTITLSDGTTKLDIPRLSAVRLIKIVKFLGVEIANLWEEASGIGTDDSYSDQEKMVQILELIPEEKLLGIVSVLTDLDDESVQLLDLNEILDIFTMYAEKTNLANTFLQIQNLYKKIFKKDLPSFKALLDRVMPAPEQVPQPATEPLTVEAGKQP